MMAIAFMGYVLPWGQMSFWGATVITNLFTAIPFFGELIAYWLWGGYSVGNATLVRFFSLHYCLPFILIGVILLHLVLLHNQGSNNPITILQITDKTFFYPYFYVKDYFGFLVVAFGFLFIISYYPDLLGHSDNYIEANALVTPAHIVPEWYFLPFYAILRAVPSKLGGVLLMGLSIAILFILPFLQIIFRSTFTPARFLYNNLIFFFFFTVILLGYLGGLPIEEPYTIVSQIFAVYYFIFFIFFIFFEYLVNFYMYQYNVNENFKKNLVNPQNNNGFLASVSLAVTPNLLVFHVWAKQVATLLFGKQNFYITQYKNFKLKVLLLVKEQLLISKHPFHLVNVSPWPFFVSLSLFAVTVGAVLYFHRFQIGEVTLFIGFSSLILIMLCWFRDIIREGTFEGHHTLLVQKGLKLGMILFIISEAMLFFSFFWAFFHSSLAPAIQIGGIWPPKGILPFNPWEVPLLNTVILLTSGVTVTWAHYAVRSKHVRFFNNVRHPLLSSKLFLLNVKQYYLMHTSTSFLWIKRLKVFNFLKSLKSLSLTDHINFAYKYINFFLFFSTYFYEMYKSKTTSIKSLILCRESKINTFEIKVNSFVQRSRHDLLLALGVTVILGIIFTFIQYYEYKFAPFTIADSVYGSTFFLTTGFHGLHVIIGTIFLFVCIIRTYKYHFTTTHHIGLESAIWYWHFVDIVWLGLYISIYHWGGNN